MVLKRISMLTWVDLEEVMDSVIRSLTESMVIPSPLTQDSSASTDTTSSVWLGRFELPRVSPRKETKIRNLTILIL